MGIIFTSKILKTENFLLKIIFICVFCIIQFTGCDKEVSVSPPDEPPPNGYLFINSNPPGSHIYLNGKERRRATPDSLTWLTTGKDTVTLKRDLYRDTSFIVNVVEGQRLSYFVDYTKNPLMKGKINCTSQPSNASIFINDSSTGLSTPNILTNILPGNYQITYKLKDHSDINSTVTVSSNNTSSLYLRLVDTTLWNYFNTENSAIITNNLSCVAVDNNNKLWIGTSGNGVIVYDGFIWNNYQAGATFIPNNSISSIAVSSINNEKWVGTAGGLVEFYGDGPNDMKVYKSPFYPFGAVYSVAANKDTLISVATDTYIVLIHNGTMDVRYPTSSNSENDVIIATTIDKQNRTWVGTRGSGVAELLDVDWNYYTQQNSGISSNQITALAEDNSGNIWVGYPSGQALANGLSFYNGTWQKFYFLPNGANTNSLYVDSKNRLWVGTNKGLVEKDGDNITTFDFDNTGLNITNVNGVVEDKSGNIWITTSDAGLFKYKGAR